MRVSSYELDHLCMGLSDGSRNELLERFRGGEEIQRLATAAATVAVVSRKNSI